ncbi:MAG TPA: hypothetical protein VI731_06855, partial [Bacteroidia bacterium]|nr:hypothetical protein [Bacteroidia bacterium]
FSIAYDQQMNYLIDLEKKGQREKVYLEPLPDPGMLVYGDEPFLQGYGLEKALGLNFEVRNTK